MGRCKRLFNWLRRKILRKKKSKVIKNEATSNDHDLVNSPDVISHVNTKEPTSSAKENIIADEVNRDEKCIAHGDNHRQNLRSKAESSGRHSHQYDSNLESDCIASISKESGDEPTGSEIDKNEEYGEKTRCIEESGNSGVPTNSAFSESNAQEENTDFRPSKNGLTFMESSGSTIVGVSTGDLFSENSDNDESTNLNQRDSLNEHAQVESDSFTITSEFTGDDMKESADFSVVGNEHAQAESCSFTIITELTSDMEESADLSTAVNEHAHLETGSSTRFTGGSSPFNCDQGGKDRFNSVSPENLVEKSDLASATDNSTISVQKEGDEVQNCDGHACGETSSASSTFTRCSSVGAANIAANNISIDDSLSNTSDECSSTTESDDSLNNDQEYTPFDYSRYEGNPLNRKRFFAFAWDRTLPPEFGMRDQYEGIRRHRIDYANARYHWHVGKQAWTWSVPFARKKDLYDKDFEDSSDDDEEGVTEPWYTTDEEEEIMKSDPVTYPEYHRKQNEKLRGDAKSCGDTSASDQIQKQVQKYPEKDLVQTRQLRVRERTLPPLKKTPKLPPPRMLNDHSIQFRKRLRDFSMKEENYSLPTETPFHSLQRQCGLNLARRLHSGQLVHAKRHRIRQGINHTFRQNRKNTKMTVEMASLTTNVQQSSGHGDHILDVLGQSRLDLMSSPKNSRAPPFSPAVEVCEPFGQGGVESGGSTSLPTGAPSSGGGARGGAFHSRDCSMWGAVPETSGSVTEDRDTSYEPNSEEEYEDDFESESNDSVTSSPDMSSIDSATGPLAHTRLDRSCSDNSESTTEKKLDQNKNTMKANTLLARAVSNTKVSADVIKLPFVQQPGNVIELRQNVSFPISNHQKRSVTAFQYKQQEKQLMQRRAPKKPNVLFKIVEGKEEHSQLTLPKIKHGPITCQPPETANVRNKTSEVVNRVYRKPKKKGRKKSEV